jgi:DNA-binding MarR family transcriptional regulator
MGQIVATFERTTHLIGSHLESAASELGITQAEAHVLAQVVRRGPTSIATLHHEFGHKRSTLTNNIDRLEERKLVRREPNPGDRRSFIVHLTASGTRAARRLTTVLDELERRVRAHLGEHDLAGLAAVADALEAVVRHRPEK